VRHILLVQLITGALAGALLFMAACSDVVDSGTSEPHTVAMKDITDVFEPIDGLTYEQAVDLYRRDQNPESEIVIWEEMVHAYSSFAEGKSLPIEEKHETYKALLLASMFPESEVFDQLKPKHLTAEDVDRINQLYRLDPEPVKVTKN